MGRRGVKRHKIPKKVLVLQIPQAQTAHFYVPCVVVRRLRLWDLPVRLWLQGVDQIDKLDGIPTRLDGKMTKNDEDRI